MSWKLYLDHELNPAEPGWTVIRSSIMAVVTIVKRKQLPSDISLNYELGDGDNAMYFLKELFATWKQWGSNPELIPQYRVHSANWADAKNIISFMENWKKSAAAKS